MIKQIKYYSSMFFKKCILFLVISFVCLGTLSPEGAYAEDKAAPDKNTTQIQLVLCKVIAQISGPIGKTIAILIVISMAISLFLGKITWGLAIAVAVGMGLLFGAKDIVNLISTDGGADVCPAETKTS